MIDFKSRYLLAKEYDTPEVDRIYTLSNNSSLFSDPEAMAEFSKMFFPATNHPYDRKLVIPSDFDDNQIALYVYYPDKRPEGELPVVYYIHGSGYLVGTADMFGTELKRIANESEVAVVSVEYRLAVKAPFPADIHDCVSGLRYLFSHGKDLGIDSNRVVLMGPSAGGGLTARLALYNRDHDKLPVKGQILIYPMLDYRTGTDEAPIGNPFGGQLLWTPAFNRLGWTTLRGGQDIPENLMPYYSASTGGVSGWFAFHFHCRRQHGSVLC